MEIAMSLKSTIPTSHWENGSLDSVTTDKRENSPRNPQNSSIRLALFGAKRLVEINHNIEIATVPPKMIKTLNWEVGSEPNGSFAKIAVSARNAKTSLTLSALIGRPIGTNSSTPTGT
jgi:hypothetical protein